MCALACVNGECRIRCVNADTELKRHVETLGLTPGTRVKVVSSNRVGCVLELRGSRIAMGAELAGSIQVDPCTDARFGLIPPSFDRPGEKTGLSAAKVLS